MKYKDMSYILEQTGTMAVALENILDFLGSSINENNNKAVYVDCSNEINFVSEADALEIIDCYGENCASEMIGKSDFIIIFNADDKVTVNGISYLLGDYLIMKSDNGLNTLTLEDMESLELEYGSRLVPFVMGDEKTEVYRLL